MIKVRTKPLRLEVVAKDISKDIESSKKRAMTRTVLHGTSIIEERTAKGIGINRAFPGYSSGWARVRRSLGLQSSTVNLEFGYERSGGDWVKRPSMLPSLQGKALSKTKGEIFFSRAEAAKRAAMVNKSRPFFGFNRAEERDLARVYFESINIKDRKR